MEAFGSRARPSPTTNDGWDGTCEASFSVYGCENMVKEPEFNEDMVSEIVDNVKFRKIRTKNELLICGCPDCKEALRRLKA